MKRILKRVCAAMAAAACVAGGAAESQLTGEQIWQLEQALYKLGYHSAECDMRLDEETKRAIRNFQIANDLEPTGEPDDRTLRRVSSDKAVTEKEYLEKLAADSQAKRVLQQGSSGSSVSAVQRRLKELGFYSGSSDGEFGEGTRAAVIRFQRANGLEETGVVDASTYLRLNDADSISFSAFLESAQAKVGDSGSAVRGIQKRLLALGYFEGACTGSYGEATQKAVYEFQSRNELPENGNVDFTTCEKLYSDVAIALCAPGAMRLGDAGASVAELNASLNALGYPADGESENYDYATETAVRLFQMANGLPTTGEADPETASRLKSAQAIGMDRVRDSFSQQVRLQSDAALEGILGAAMALRGREFEPFGAELCDGFAFVEYVCVAAGVPVTDAEELGALVSEPVEDVNALQMGEIIAFYPDGDTEAPCKMGVYAGSRRMICATKDEPWVLECDITENGGTLCRWKLAVG